MLTAVIRCRNFMTLRHLYAALWFLGTLISVPCAQGQGGSIAQTGKASTERCYDFEVKNDQEKRNITDLHFHFPRGMKPEHMQVPTGWGWTAGADSLSFETPPTNATGTVSPNPVKPDSPALSGFRFCLPKETKDITISTSFNEGANSAVRLFQGVEADSETPVRKTSHLHCFKLKITAPPETAVYDIHLRGSISSPRPGFDDFELPKGWKVQGVEATGADIELGDTPLEGGKSEEIGVCVTGSPEVIKWTFTDKEHKDIKNAEGETKLKL
jgi:hypothetical protein